MRLLKKHIQAIDAAMPVPVEPVKGVSSYDRTAILKQWEDLFKKDPVFSKQSTSANMGWTSILDTKEGVHYKQPYGERQGNNLGIYLKNPYNEDRWSQMVHLYLFFDKENRLVMSLQSSYESKHWLVGDRSQPECFIRLVQDFYEEAHKEAKKNQKIRDLKANSVVARLKIIAEEDDFEYSYEQSTTRMTLHVKLSSQSALSIAVPFSKFQEVMQELRPMVRLARDMAEKGIVFKIQKPDHYTHWNNQKHQQ